MPTRQVPEHAALSDRTRCIEAGQDLEVTVPATSANLGPGFDSLGLAVGLLDTVRVRTGPTGRTVVVPSGEGAALLPTDATHLVARSLLSTLANAGWSSPGLEVETVNVIPHGRGLGSSAAAIVSGVLAANALLPEAHRLDDAAVLQWCAALEGHPDNVAPALLGSLAISWESGRAYQSTRIEVHPDIIPIAAIPDTGRAALLVHALTLRPDLLPAGTRDALHQEYRAPAMLPSAALMQRLRAQGFASVISGAGPTVMTLAAGEDQAAQALDAVRSLVAGSDTPGAWRILRLDVAREGAKVRVHQR
jgi:homoserine kinase